MLSDIERLENEYNAKGRECEDRPERWGEEQEARVAEIIESLRNLYEAAQTPEIDRIVGI
jgi:hypothetical protein